MRRRQSGAAGVGAQNGSAGTPTNGPGTSSSVKRDPSRPPQAVVISQDSNDSALTSARSNLAAEPPNSSSSTAPLNEVIIQLQRDRGQPPPAGSRAERFASLGSSRLPASQLQECDAALELDVVSSTPHPLGQAVVGAEAASASASVQSPQVRLPQSQYVSPRAIQPRSLHRSSTTADAARVSPDDSSTATQPSSSTSHAALAVPSSQSAASAMSSLQASVPSPPRSRSKSRGRAPVLPPSTSDSESSHHAPAVAAQAHASALLAVHRSEGAGVAAQQRDGERVKKRSSEKPKDASPPLTATHRLRVLGAQIEEC